MMYEKSFVNLLSSQAIYFKKLSNMLGIVVNLSDDLTNVSVDGALFIIMMYEKSFVNLLSSQAIYFKKLSNMLGIVVNLSDDLTNVSVDGVFSSF